MSEGVPRLERIANTPVGPFAVGEVLPVPFLVALALWDTVLGHSDLVSGPPWAVAAVMSAAAVALLWRRRHPLLVLAAIALLASFQTLVLGPTHSTGGALCLAIALFACGAHGARPWAYLGIIIGMGLVLIDTWTDDPAAFADSWAWSLNMLWVFGLGALVRHHMQLTARARDAADAHAAASAAEERLAVARDLHDVLAHSLAVMIVQAEAADELIDSDPLRAHRALARVEETGRSALGDIRLLLEALRNDGRSTATTSSTAPGLDALPRLLDTVRASGLPVELHVRGDIDGVSSQSGQVIYRVVQEALTNTMRHAGAAPTVVAIDVDESDVRVHVHDDGTASSVAVGTASHGTPPSTGRHGLQGMRERVTYAGGTLEAGPDAVGGFSVKAVLPREGPIR